MSQPTPPTADTTQAPPEERFWKRYSPHHEFPLSSVGSVVLHILSIGALVVIGYVITRTRPDEQLAPPIVGVVTATGLKPQDAGGGGEPDGSEKSSGGTTKDGQEIVQNTTPPDPQPGNVAAEKPVPIAQLNLQAIQVVQSTDGNRLLLGENKQILGDLNAVMDQARKKLAEDAARAARGKQGTGVGGGKDKGKDKGTGPGKGPGEAVGGTIRQNRQARWKMMFDTTGGADYLQQLKGLGAFLGVPQLKGDKQIEYLLIRDPRPNAEIKREDVSKLNRIFWFDHETRSVLGMARALGLRTPPPFFVAFFPQELEKRLRDLEQQAFSGDEERISETRFRVINRGGGLYEVVLDRGNPIVLKR